jgi:signal transduction histidine kinase
MKFFERLPIRTLATVLLAGIAVAASIASMSASNGSQGTSFEYDNGQLMIASVEYGSQAQIQGVSSGAVVEWLDGTYVPGLSDQAKRDIARSEAPWTQIATVSPDQATADLAVYERLVVVARRSDVAWISNPESNPWPPCYTDGSCLPYAMHSNSDDISMGYGYSMLGYSMLGDAVCIPTDGSQLFTIPGPTPSVPAAGADQGLDRFIGGFCVTSAPSAGGSYYGYMPNQSAYSWWWIPAAVGPVPTTLGLAILLAGWLVIGRGWLGTGLKPFALTLPVATAIPLLVLPIDRYLSEPAVVAGALLVPLGMIPLALDFLGRVDGRRRRRVVAALTVALAVASVAAGLLIPTRTSPLTYDLFVSYDLLEKARLGLMAGCLIAVPVLLLLPLRISFLTTRQRLIAVPLALLAFLVLNTVRIPDYVTVYDMRLWRAALAGAVAFLPGLLAARPFHRLPSALTVGPGQKSRALVESADIALGSMAPGIAAISLVYPTSVLITPILVWIAVLLLATRFTLRPLARLVTSAQLQRDLIVAATEAERMRIAADIHDDALQDLTMLVRRLDAAGDTANAEAARDIAERLRAICGDLRLPVLDDLGVGPALEWLCGRLSSAKDPIALDRSVDESRLPADVELAVFRIAQEALSNAVRHGAPPVAVRYRAGSPRVELTVEDCGSGIPDGAAELAEQTGHMGLLNMTQRAEAIGATLKTGRKPDGGTRVSLIWEGPAVPAGTPALAPA